MIEAVPYRMPRLLDKPRFNTSHGPAPILAWMVRYTPKPFTNKLIAASNIFKIIALLVRFSFKLLFNTFFAFLVLVTLYIYSFAKYEDFISSIVISLGSYYWK